MWAPASKWLRIWAPTIREQKHNHDTAMTQWMRKAVVGNTWKQSTPGVHKAEWCLTVCFWKHKTSQIHCSWLPRTYSRRAKQGTQTPKQLHTAYDGLQKKKTYPRKRISSILAALEKKSAHSLFSLCGMTIGVWDTFSSSFLTLWLPPLAMHTRNQGNEAALTILTRTGCRSYRLQINTAVIAPFHNTTSRPKFRSMYCTSSKAVCINSPNSTNMHRVLKSFVLLKDGFCFLRVKKSRCSSYYSVCPAACQQPGLCEQRRLTTAAALLY